MVPMAGWSTGSSVSSGTQVLLADVGDVGRFRIFGEQVVERLVPGRPDRLGDCVIPFVAVGELGIDVEHDSAKIEEAMLDDVADREAGQGHVDLLRHVLVHGGKRSKGSKGVMPAYLGNGRGRC